MTEEAKLIRNAFIWAEQDRLSLAKAWPEGSVERDEFMAQYESLRRYRMERWPQKRTKSDGKT